MGNIATAAILATSVTPDVDAIAGFNGSLVLRFLLGILLLVVVVVAIKEINKSDKVKVKDTLEYAGNNAIVFLVLVLALGGFFWVLTTDAIGSVLG